MGAMVSMNPDGAGSLGTVGVAGYVGQSGSSKIVQSLSNVKYIFSNGAAVGTFPNSNTAALTGQYYLDFSPDGNFVFAGSPISFSLPVGESTGTGAPNFNATHYDARLIQA